MLLEKKLSKSSPIPLYQQLVQLIEDEINNDFLHDGDVLPTEKELCHAFEISRLTVREAINVLKQKKLIETKRGIGNFVTKTTTVNRDLLGVHNFDLQIEASGHKNKVTLMEFDKDYHSSVIAHKLGLSAEASLLKVQRLRSVDDTPLFIEDIYLSSEQFPALTEEDFYSTKFLSKKLRESYGVVIGEIALELEPVLLTQQQADTLHVNVLPAAGLMNERISYDANLKPVVLSQWLFSQSRCKHVLKIKVK
ncbi:GntR family transcriptional regulator [Pelistega europaea]|uniref:GntR family transcriptional regulator n=1 Tax=Pelistega europaea TaxID=106147 RepID=A0A7Y4LCA3_9BURK|nr:GntR family transcriptional regulator [Pelistega europaea]NOL49896.1 GntR family transcriptional regulator [Pelistega europaea]